MPTQQEKPARGRKVRGLDAAQRQERRRRELHGAALELFARKGYHRTSVEELCQAACVGTKGFYELFDNKEACYLDLFEQLSADLLDAVAASLDSFEAGDLEPAVVIEAFARQVVTDPRVLRVVFEEAAAISTADEQRRRHNRRDAAALVVTAWQRMGIPLEDECARPIALGLIGGLFEILLDWSHEHESIGEPGITVLIARMTALHDKIHRGLSANRAAR